MHLVGHYGGTIKSSNGPVVFPLLCFHIDSVEPHGNRTDMYPALDVTPHVVKLVLVRNYAMKLWNLIAPSLRAFDPI